MKGFFDRYYQKCMKIGGGHFNLLLISLILLFIFRPYDRGTLYLAIWQLFLFAVFVAATLNCNHSKKTKIVASCIAVPALVFQWLNLIFNTKILALPFLFLTIVFVFIITGSIIKRVVLNARVKMETLIGVVCAYFMVAFGFSFAYFFVDLITPGSFYFANIDPTLITHSHYLSEMMYFSFVTLLCIGYGDILAIKDVAQTCAILEGIIGQFYIAILVSRLVAVYSFFEHKLHLVAHNPKDR
ncbi:ion channel [Candidatus Neptunochlamydia vexilliferae]|uniref:Potassium channel domain-containing protein n=1 Tax=Candidatus Neptunichlamydia vexilliferae TaxID=1651774 RepID=A0ABS0AX25_9BACT|nr:ion channel [Candidatus Neptunochlamydia vexilliferae]MBF5058683.1 hypothetical protein [Candidatus Neptunochlamydia vexilliferae]